MSFSRRSTTGPKTGHRIDIIHTKCSRQRSFRFRRMAAPSFDPGSCSQWIWGDLFLSPSLSPLVQVGSGLEVTRGHPLHKLQILPEVRVSDRDGGSDRGSGGHAWIRERRADSMSVQPRLGVLSLEMWGNPVSPHSLFGPSSRVNHIMVGASSRSPGWPPHPLAPPIRRAVEKRGSASGPGVLPHEHFLTKYLSTPRERHSR